MTRRYEIVYIFNSAVEEAQVDQTLERFHVLLKSEENPEPIRNVNHWGKRTLAYSIGNNEIGYYVVVQFATDPTLLPEFERLLKLEESVIRYQIVLNEGEVPVPAPLPDTGDGGKPSDGPSKPDADLSKGGGQKDSDGPSKPDADVSKGSGQKDSDGPSKPDTDVSKGSGQKDEEGANEEN